MLTREIGQRLLHSAYVRKLPNDEGTRDKESCGNKGEMSQKNVLCKLQDDMSNKGNNVIFPLRVHEKMMVAKQFLKSSRNSFCEVK